MQNNRSLCTLCISSLLALGAACSTRKSVDNHQIAKGKAAEASLVITTSTGKTKGFDVVALEGRYPKTVLVVKANPAYKGRTKKYEGFDLAALIKDLDPKVFSNNKNYWIEVTTLDGWKAPAYEARALLKSNALLAIRESPETIAEPYSDDKLWTLIVTSKKTLSPGPFYLVWNDKGLNPDVMPLQVATIKILKDKAPAR